MYQMKRTLEEKDREIMHSKRTHEQIFNQLKKQIDDLNQEKKKQ
jgi:hypothetical protein